MQTLKHPILHDCARLIDRHTGISPEYKTRLLLGLAAIDRVLEVAEQVAPAKDKPAKGAK